MLIGVVVTKHEVCDYIMGTFNSIDNLGFWMDLELSQLMNNRESHKLSFRVSLLELRCNISRKSKWTSSLSLSDHMISPPNFVHY